MEVKGQLISSMGLGAPELQAGQESRLQAQRRAALQERKHLLETLLTRRVGELRHVCLQEAELTGTLSHGFPLQEGERPPLVQRRAGPKFEEDPGQRRQTKALLTGGTVYRSTESDRNHLNNKRTVHRGCHTEDAVISESTSSMSDSTSHDNGSPPRVAVDQRSLSQPRLSAGSPDQRTGRRRSPVELYYEMRTRRNSVTSSGRSDPAGGGTLKWSGSLDVPPLAPLALDGSCSSDHRGGPYASRARRSNSSDALLDRGSLSEPPPPPPPPPPRNGMPPSRGGPYKSSEALMDGKLRQLHPGSPERHAEGPPAEPATLRLSVGGRGGGGGGGGYNEMLMEYIWGKQQRAQPPLYQNPGLIWQEMSASRSSSSSGGGPPPPPPPHAHANGFSHSQVHLPSAAGPYSPMVLRGSQAESRRVKVTRTKSCGPFIPLQHDGLLLSAYEAPHPASGASTSSNPNLYPCQAEGPGPGRRAPQFSLPAPEDSARSLHKALALEGLRDWYLRNALGYPSSSASSSGPKGHEAGVSRLSHPHPLAPQGPAGPGEPPTHQRTQMTTSASFHGHPLHGRTVEFSLYQEPLPPPMQDAGPKEPSADPGTLV